MTEQPDTKLAYSRIASEQALTELVGEPGDIARFKGISALDVHCRDFIQRSPFVLLASADADGRCDVSPRGGAAGFVRVLDAGHLAIGEAPGNRRVDSLRNILQNPHVGMLFLIPGVRETLRVNGRAGVSNDDELLRMLGDRAERTPNVAITVDVEEAFLHCAKALIRGSLWEPEAWPDSNGLAPPARIWKDHAGLAAMTVTEIDDLVKQDYRDSI